ncbi:hypothetical protein QCA50_010180 [Cerrena zonata]|uniref:Large ribosomal subunit protein mL40 n=1 Tax=Cerrena zonata TaxID=2478898 RepID=A0AAW0FZE1_9APHY
MASTFLSLRKTRIPFRIGQTSVRHAAAEHSGNDIRKDLIRRILYPTNIRNGPSPTGTWLPDVGRRLQRAIPSVQAHETIERAWLLHQRHIRRRRMAEAEKKFQCMHSAMEKLRELSPKLYEEANKDEDPRARSPEETEIWKSLKKSERRAFDSRIRGLFPREMRTPTETPPTGGWNYDYQPILRKSTTENSSA